MKWLAMIGIGFLLDLILGDPYSWPHPVKLIGNLIAKLTQKCNRPQASPLQKRLSGLGTWILVVGLTLLVSQGIMWVAHFNPIVEMIIGSYLCYTCISVKGLAIEGKKIATSLSQNDLKQARYQVGMIVGRDTNQLSAEEVCNATIETIAENTSDGVVAPILFMMIGGPVLGLGYKAINTLDSMVGYKNQKYQDFGWASASLDDVFNYLPARLTWGFLIIASWLLRYDFKNAVVVGIKDREQHKSPNSGFSESVVAGALNLRLGGPHDYFGQLVVKPFIGNEKHHPSQNDDIFRAIKMLYTAAIVGLLGLGLIKLWILKIGGFI